ncbi:lasso peptide biosynthesis B2 protein [Xanthomonas campestris]|uniref:lasso peptide biosynthesis B2 protein n=1 Tax=Xanthomonas campestris TaxID=339 RepID=UPI00096F79A3|nr:lasso peptide biosynthesis B2 protein [Xanthomonas campestris]MCF8826461.1 lasso peptide biosynthesis B2 protein [Xanthomonas campestris pv. raphani]MEA9838942.1 lasso peptide biosynthesis B2 protein [Xanthomonas campestris pv. raphani]MEA9878468.1 lasso peptide biosynthesis B2 protein [Xanthomonas campestris pv. raphani]MEA9894889.1 lasso peptide biosynthesis B2 protein [Xanthomonas campestris pv. raphani]MEA9934529.1 lasso peptide biosynthesis B2 protein [Xanthomonas campestris pv. raphan
MREMASSPSYLLSTDAHVCVAGGIIVLLDVATGTYLSIGRQQAALLGGHILGWPVPTEGQDMSPVLQTLIDRRLVTTDPTLGKPATCAKIAMPVRWLREGESRGRPDFALRDLHRFAVSAAFAACAKKCASLRSIVARAQRRSLHQPRRDAQLDELAALVRKFDWLRPLAFKKTDECFLYCFALSEFLSRYGFFPSWVFAVRTSPFTAHCWLQHGDYVLTDIPFNLRRMVPILVL